MCTLCNPQHVVVTQRKLKNRHFEAIFDARGGFREVSWGRPGRGLKDFWVHEIASSLPCFEVVF